jgi:hypothetical protein
MNHIDVSSVLRETLASDRYSNLVTRGTGAAVRRLIERLLNTSHDRMLTIIDFSQVSMMDFSCADEVIAKLLMRYASDDAPRDAYFIFRGVAEDHRDAIETVLERRGLALALEQADRVELVGVVSEDERRVWDASYRLGRAPAADVARQVDADLDDALHVLDVLCRRRLMMRVDDDYVVVGDSHHG